MAPYGYAAVNRSGERIQFLGARMALRTIDALQILLISLAMAAGTAVGRADAPSQVEEGAAQLVHGDVDKAIATYTDALRDTGLPNDRRATILNDRAVANGRLGQTKLALEDFNRAVELFPEYPVAYNNRGNLLLAVGQYREATKDFDRALVLAPGYAAAYSNRAQREDEARKAKRCNCRLHQSDRTDARQRAAVFRAADLPISKSGNRTPRSGIFRALSVRTPALRRPIAIGPKRAWLSDNARRRSKTFRGP